MKNITYVSELSNAQQATIKSILLSNLSQDLNGIELEQAINDGMDSKVSDLQEHFSGKVGI